MDHESNDVLKTQLEVVKSELKALQKDYDILSNELMKAHQENADLQKELRQRPLSIDSMKSSATEVALQHRHRAEIKELQSLKEKLLKAAEEQQQKLHSPKADRDLALNALKLKNEMLKQDIQELQGKCEELEMDKLKQDKINLQLQNWRARLKLPSAHENLVSEHNELVGSLNKQIKELNERYEQLIIYTDNLREEKSILQVRIGEADAQHSETLKKLHKLRMEMDEMSKQKATEKLDLEEKLETIAAKKHDLEEELQSSKLKVNRYDELSSENERLLSKLLASGKEISNQDLKTEELRWELKHALEANDTVSAEKLSLATQLQALNEETSSRTKMFEMAVTDLNSLLNELKLKLRAKSVELEETNTRLKEQLLTKEAELKQKCAEIDQKYEQGCLSIAVLTAELEKFRADLQAKDAEWESMRESCINQKIATDAANKKCNQMEQMLYDKRNLEEKQCTLNESNTSSGSWASVARKRLDCNPTPCVPRISGGITSEVRKSRRVTAHDEHRSLSGWSDSLDCGTMTDPEDSQSLSMKLQACQQDLYYRNCEVFALNMELKQHKQRRDAQMVDSHNKEIAEPREK